MRFDWIHKIWENRYGKMAAILIGNIVLFTLAVLLLPVQYEENDDIVMAMIANGAYSGTPDCHLVYINVIYGAVLAWLYGLTTAVEWYTLAFAVLHIVSMTVICYGLVTYPNRARWERVLWLCVLYILWARIVVSLQFTTTAGLVCLAGCVLLMDESRAGRWSGAALVVIAALIRFMAAGLVGLLMAPIIIYTLRLQWRRYMPIVVMLMAIVGCRAVNHYVYDSDPEWRYYREYNQWRAQLNDNPNAHRLRPENMPDDIDWMDYQLLLRFIPDPEQIDLKAIRQLSAIVDEVPLNRQWTNLARLTKYWVELSMLLAMLVLMILTTGNRGKYIFLILYTAFLLLLIVHVSLDGFLKNRVFLCMLTPVLTTYFLLLPNTTGRKRKYAMCLAMLVMGGWYISRVNLASIANGYRTYQWTHLQQPLLEYIPDDANNLTLGTSMTMQATDIWHIWPYRFHKYSFGWTTCIPFNRAVASSYRDLLREDMYIFTQTGYDQPRTTIPRVQEQVLKHYGIQTRVHPVCHNGGYALIRLEIDEE